MGWESSGVVRFNLGPLLQGQTRIAKVKITYNLLIIGTRGLGWETNLLEIMGRLKSVYNLLITDPRGLQYETNSYEILG